MLSDDTTLRVVVEIDDAPDDADMREDIRARIERRLRYGVSFRDMAADVVIQVVPDRVHIIEGAHP